MQIDADMHIHTRYCGHADQNMEVRQIIEQAERRGLQTIAITDHIMVGSCKEDTASLENIMKEVRAADKSIHVLIGAEIDADPFQKGKLVLEDESVLRNLAFVSGSIHHWPDDGVIWHTKKSLSAAEKTRAVDDYFIWYEKISRNPLVDVMAHPGVFLAATALITEFDRTIRKRFVPILENMKNTGKKFELNELASGKMGQDAWATYGWLVGLARELDIPFVIGSDAHSLDQIGRMPNVMDLIGKQNVFTVSPLQGRYS